MSYGIAQFWWKKVCQTLTLFCDLKQRYVVIFQGSVGWFRRAGCFFFGGVSWSCSQMPTEAAVVWRPDGVGQQDGALTRSIYSRGLCGRGGQSSDTRPLVGAGGSHNMATVNKLFRRVDNQLLISHFWKKNKHVVEIAINFDKNKLNFFPIIFYFSR